MTRLHKISLLPALALVLCLLATLPLAAPYSQQNNPDKEKLFRALRERRLLKRDLKLVIRQMQEQGVPYELTAADEQEIRRLGSYLGKKGLDDLIVAVRDNYRPDVSQQPQRTTPQTLNSIQSIMVEGRLTCSLKEGAELPPAEVPFIPVGDANAYLEGPQGRVALNFVSPVRFRRQDDNSIVIINRFSLPNGSDLQGRPIESMKTFETLIIPSVTIVWGKSMATMKIFEASMTINGQDAWYYSYRLGVPFQQGPVLRIPLETLMKTTTQTQSSINQTMTNSPGGIQAGGNVIINRGIQPRKLTDEQEGLFVKILKDNPKGSVEISCIESGGPEPCDFARQLARLLESKDAGWSVNFSPIMFGAGDPTKTIPEMYILVQSSKNPPPRAIVLQYALKSVGYDAIGIARSDVAVDFVQLTVWFRRP